MLLRHNLTLRAATPLQRSKLRFVIVAAALVPGVHRKATLRALVLVSPQSLLAQYDRAFSCTAHIRALFCLLSFMSACNDS